MPLKNLTSLYDRLCGRKAEVEKQLAQFQNQLDGLEQDALIAEEAKSIVRIVSLETQRQLEFRIAETVTHAESAVFDDPYEFTARFEERAGKTACQLKFKRDGMEADPLASTGMGTVDIAAAALRCACWSFKKQSSPVFLMDEPFKHLKGVEPNRRAIGMMHEIAKELGIQILTISDERAPREDIIAGADRVFEVSKNKSGSVVEVL